jgi:hypothetical protein
MTVIKLTLSLYIIINNNDTLLNKFEYISNSNLFVSVSKFESNINNNKLYNQQHISLE